MMNYKVYVHIFPNGKKYIGITKQEVEKRWLKGNGYKENKYMFRAIKKYGWENIKHIVLFENLTKEEAEQKEIELIKFFKSNERQYGYNIQNGGNCIGTFSEETKKKISKALKGNINGINSRRGKHHTESAKEKLRQAILGRHLSEETKKKISNSNKGKTKGPLKKETKEKLRKHNLGKKLSEETKQKISQNSARYWLGKTKPKEFFEKESKKVICIETGIIYYSTNEVERQTKIKQSSISAVCNGKRKTAGKMHWEFYKEMI